MTNLRGTFHHRRLTVERLAERFNGLFGGTITADASKPRDRDGDG
jgi:hypothetical protein